MNLFTAWPEEVALVRRSGGAPAAYPLSRRRRFFLPAEPLGGVLPAFALIRDEILGRSPPNDGRPTVDVSLSGGFFLSFPSRKRRRHHPPQIDTLAEAPIDGLFLENVTIEGRCGQAFRCQAFVGNNTSGNIQHLYATGDVQ